ncbi:MAG TPA: phage holin family protein [Candidatus Binataceae bacterium]|jgi:hypothetical protein|nr:phage holin family protein [Candidatus Binataceae bacterium]
MAPDSNQLSIHEADQPHSWPDLVGKLILDFTRVLEAELRLMRASIEPALTSVLNRWLWQLVIASIALLGCILLVGAIILFLHLWLAWWASFAITGAATVLLALCAMLIH